MPAAIHRKGSAVSKKIRYAIGAVGATPALAMILVPPAATAASHAGKPPASTGKKARTVYARDTAANLVNSIASSGVSSGTTFTNGPAPCSSWNTTGHSPMRTSPRGHFTATFDIGPHGCVHEVSGSLNYHQNDRLMRVRVNKSGHTFQAPLAHGTGNFGLPDGFTVSGVNHKGAQVCAALVNQNNTHSVTNGPVCLAIP